jgi:hypothetical protein
MDRPSLRAAQRHKFYDPASYLLNLRKLELEIARSDTPYKIRSLRTNGLKQAREQRQAALFCFGMSLRIGQTVYFAPHEEQDYDFIASWVVEGQQHLAPVQLKEVVPASLNPAATLDAIVASLSKYTDSRALTVAVHLNQSERFEPDQLRLPNLDLAAVWVFAAASPDQATWNLWGNFTESEPSGIQFTYPTEA